MMKKSILLLSVVLTLLLIAGGVWAYMSYFYTKPLTQQELHNLTPDWTKVTQGNWSPWYTDPDGTQTWNPAASFNEFLSTIPEEDKAWAVLIDVYYANSELLDRKKLRSEPGSLEWDLLQVQLETTEIDDLVHRTAEAFRRPYLGEGFSNSTSEIEHEVRLAHQLTDEFWDPNPNQNPCLINGSGLYMHKHLDIVYLVSAYAKLQLLRENPDSFVSLIESAMLSGRLVSEYLKPIDFLMRSIVEKNGFSTISWALEHHADKFSEQHLNQLDSLIVNTDSPYDLFTGPLLICHDMVRRLIGIDGKLSVKNMSFIMEGTSKSVCTPDAKLDHSIQRLLYEENYYHDLAQKTIEPKENLQTKNIVDVFNSRRHFMGFAVEKFLEGEIFVFDTTTKRRRDISNSATELRIKLATQRHTLRHGSPPASQSDIDPDLLPD